MSYRIDYNPELKKRYPNTRKRRSNPHYVVLALLLLFVVVYGLLQTDFLQIIVPGDPEITIPAFSKMVKSVGEGESVRTAITQFCRDIIAGGM